MSKKPAASKSKARAARPKAAKKPAKRASARADKARITDAQPVDTGAIRRYPTGGCVKDMMAEKEAAKTKVGKINGALRAMIAEACKNEHLDKYALRLLTALWPLREKPEKLGVAYDHFIDYFEKSGLKKIAESVGKLDLQPPAGDESAEGDEGDGDEAGPPTEILPGEQASDDVSQPRFTH